MHYLIYFLIPGRLRSHKSLDPNDGCFWEKRQKCVKKYCYVKGDHIFDNGFVSVFMFSTLVHSELSEHVTIE